MIINIVKDYNNNNDDDDADEFDEITTIKGRQYYNLNWKIITCLYH